MRKHRENIIVCHSEILILFNEWIRKIDIFMSGMFHWNKFSLYFMFYWLNIWKERQLKVVWKENSKNKNGNSRVIKLVIFISPRKFHNSLKNILKYKRLYKICRKTYFYGLITDSCLCKELFIFLCKLFKSSNGVENVSSKCNKTQIFVYRWLRK